eukprot:356323-Chlamydomonas_euryale.AAC.5
MYGLQVSWAWNCWPVCRSNFSANTAGPQGPIHTAAACVLRLCRVPWHCFASWSPESDPDLGAPLHMVHWCAGMRVKGSAVALVCWHEGEGFCPSRTHFRQGTLRETGTLSAVLDRPEAAL